MAEHGAEAQLRHAPSARKSCRHVARPESVACPPTDEFARGHHRLVAFPGAERGCAPHYPQRRDGRVAVLQPLLRHEQFDETDDFMPYGRNVDGDARKRRPQCLADLLVVVDSQQGDVVGDREAPVVTGRADFRGNGVVSCEHAHRARQSVEPGREMPQPPRCGKTPARMHIARNAVTVEAENVDEVPFPSAAPVFFDARRHKGVGGKLQ